ncbi:GNAT family N-acetyltransferase [Micromonospora sp. C28SCA-DRY-2]|uniref:GNAT family N-acetyltransferase n=1 Tax=Micromonospora sp. C28SCA-DRY-2 TaxID=3059522 RepID=UPI002676B7A7|nr:GNAT family N-acetyltransferase [Micromonospora sp. C28SCA-DRY-2]MDO3700220.1 GNAT family N-acetyltransferase [Micromonospora sp. C28SCA-DRY-2]
MHQELEPDYPILTPRLALRPHRTDDLDDLLEFHGDPEVVRFLPWPLRDRAATNAALTAKLDQATLTEPGQWLVLAVELRETKTVIGEILLKWASAEHRQGELGFVLARAHQGKGYAAEAAAAMLRLGFEDLGLHRITAVCVEGNISSARLLRRLGFSQEARLVDDIWFKGGWATRLLFALTEDAWRTPATTGRDREEIDALIRCYFDAFTSGSGVDERMAALRDAMLPGAIIVRTCGMAPAVYDVDAFIEPRQAMLTDGTLTDFKEEARSGRLDLFGDIAQWFGRYAKQGRMNGAPHTGGGMKSIQFVRTDAGWRISAAAWDDDRPQR